MDGSNWRPPSQESAAAAADGVDWRSQLQHDFRTRIIGTIMDTLTRHLPCSGNDGMSELHKIAVRFEEKVFSAATNQPDYVRRISLKMLTMETKSQNNNMRNTQDPASQNAQSSQVLSQEQQLMMENVAHNSTLQNQISGISHNNPMGNSLVQGATSNLFTNPQKQIQGRQLGNSQQQIQQTQNPQQYMMCQQDMQQNMLKQKQNQNIQQPLLVQPQMHQQEQRTQQQNNLLQSSQLQVMQNSSLMQPSLVSGLAQNQQSSSMRQPAQSIAQQHKQSAVRQQPSQQTQLGSVIHHLPAAHMSQQALLPNHQQQQRERLLGRQSTLGGLSAQTQNNSQNWQRQMMGQQNKLWNMHQQQIGSQGHVGTLPSSQQILPGHSNSSSMPMSQYPLHMMQQPKALSQPQKPNAPGLLRGGGQGQQPQPQQQRMPQVQSHTEHLQQQLPNTLHSHIQQRLQSPNSLHQQQNPMDQQKMFQRPPVEAPSNSTAETGTSGDWQEEVYQKSQQLKQVHRSQIHQQMLQSSKSCGNLGTAIGKSSATEDPLLRLLRAVKAVSPKTLSSAVNEISSVVSLIDRIAGSMPGNGFKAAVGEDLVAMTKCRLQARNCITQDGGNGGLKRKRQYCTSAMPLDVTLLFDSPTTDSFKQAGCWV